MKYFTIAEMCASTTATAMHINNTPTSSTRGRIMQTINNLLDPIRAFYGLPIKINSGYRSRELNAALGGASNSSHMYGYAADIVPANGDMKTLQKAVLAWAKVHNFDQVIIEQPDSKGIASWIHVGWKRGYDNSQRRQYLTARKVNGKWTYTTFVNK